MLTLSSARVVEQHRLTSYAHRDYRLACFYCSGQDASERKSYQTVLRSLLCQAAYDHVRGTVASAVLSKFRQGENSFLFSMCEELFRAIMEEGIKLRIVIDALDECDEWDKLLEALRRIVESKPSQCQLLVSGRPEVKVQRHFPEASIIEVIKHITKGDMRDYITQEVIRPDIRDRMFCGEREDLERRLIDVLSTKANGMYVTYTDTREIRKLTASGLYGSSYGSPSSRLGTKPVQPPRCDILRHWRKTNHLWAWMIYTRRTTKSCPEIPRTTQILTRPPS